MCVFIQTIFYPAPKFIEIIPAILSGKIIGTLPGTILSICVNGIFLIGRCMVDVQ